MKTRIDVKWEPYIELSREEVSHRALQLWRAAGRPMGRKLEYWLQAEVELLAEHRDALAGCDSFAEAA